jgi:HK97 family phage portal protein
MGLRSYLTNMFSGTAERATDVLKGSWQSISNTKSGVSVTKENSLTIAGVYTAVRVYTDAIASLPTHVINDTGESKNRNVNHPVYGLVSRKPNSLMTNSVFWNVSIPHLLLWGNSYSIIEWQKGGSRRPISIMPVHPSKVKVHVLDGILVYEFKIGDDKIVLDQSNVLHFRGMGDEVEGKSVIDYARDNLALGKASEDFGSKFFSNGANQSGILTTDQVLNDKAITNLRQSLERNHGGVTSSQKTMILEQGLKYQTTSVPPDSAQFLETRRFSIEDIARWFKLPPDKLADLTRATFSNLEQQDLNFVKHSILPLVINLEEELTRKLLREMELNTTYIKKNLDGLLRGDIKTRYEAYQSGIQNGIISPNEARGKEGMNPYEGGDSKFMPLNLAPIDSNGTNQIQDEKED